MSKLLDVNIEKGVKNMDLRGLSSETNTQNRKGVTDSPIIQQDINSLFNIGAGITPYMTADNAFFAYIHKHYADKSNCKLPYLVDSKVLRTDTKYLRCIADSHIKISPYGFFEGAAAAGLGIYQRTMKQLSSKVNFNFLIQSYFLYSSLCLGISSNGKINLITSNAAIINAIPADDSDKRGAIKRVNPITDDYNNGIVQCVELIQKPLGYVLRPAIINASKQDYLILPMAWVDYLITYINNVIKVSTCKISYYAPDGSLQSAIVSNRLIKGNTKHYLAWQYIKNSSTNIGWIRAAELKNGEIIAFPISHFSKIEPLK